MTASARTPRSQPADLPAQYDPAATERELYAQWTRAGVFTAHPERTTREPDGRYVSFRPMAAEASSFNVVEVRVYTEDVAGFQF